MRRAGPSDAAAIRDLTRAVYAKWIPLIGREPKPMTADYDKAVREHWIDVVEDSAGMCGLVELIAAHDHMVIENLAVAERAQRHGLGAQLLYHAEKVATAAGFTEIRLYTNAAFATNLAYYPRHGYREIARKVLPDRGIMVHFSKHVS